MHWRRKWQPTPVFLPGESQGGRSLVGCRPWGAQNRTRLKRLSSSSSSFKVPESGGNITKFVTTLISLFANSKILGSCALVLIDWFLSWFGLYLPASLWSITFDWIPDIVSFLLLVAKYFYGWQIYIYIYMYFFFFATPHGMWALRSLCSGNLES